MPYLNWKNAAPTQLEQDVRPSASSGSEREFQLRLQLSGELLQELIPQLEEIFDQQGPELRVDLPREWIVFWKLRIGESRLLMAHPQPDEWVSTLALSAVHGKRVIEALQALSSGETVSLEKIGEKSGSPGHQTSGQTNVEVLITRI